MSCAVYTLQLKLTRCISEASNSSIAASLTQLKNVFRSVESHLEDAELLRAQASGDQGLLEWVSKVCKLSNQVENLVDMYCYFRSSYNETKFFASVTKTSPVTLYLINLILFGCSQIAAFPQRLSFIQSETMLVSLSKKVVESHVPDIIAEAPAMRLAPNTLVSNASSVDVRRTHNGVGEFDSLIGREKEVKEIKDLITRRNSMNSVEIVAVEGAEGIGKTAIAKAVFNGVKGEFDCYAWVVFSHQNTTAVSFLKDVIRGLFDSLSLIGPSNFNDVGSVAPLKELIRRCVDGKNFLLVIDDISSHQEVSASLLDALPPYSGGKILLTSRGMDISKERSHIIKIEALKPLDSLKLLRRSCNMDDVEGQLWPSVKSTAEEITKMCHYVPLAIKTIGGLLSTKLEVSEWINVLEKLSKSDVLPLCYAGMRPALRTCFLYASLLAERGEFSCKMLQRMWIAEGFIEAESNRTLEDTAKFLMADLIRRNFFQVVRVGMDGEIKTCSLLRPIREFATRRCMEDRFGAVVSNKLEIDWTRCLSVYGGDDINLDGLDLTGIRSLFLMTGYKYQKILRSWNTGFKLLAVLELGHLPINSLPDMFGNLVLLHYLGLRGTEVKTLPKSIGRLRRLQTLDARETMITEMPPEIETLIHLRDLLLSGSFIDKVVILPVNIDHFADIQTLAGVKLTQEMAKQLCLLSELRKLSVGEVRRELSKDLLKSAYQTDCLRSLTIKCAVGEGFNIVESQNPPTSLEKLRLGGQIQGLEHWTPKLNSLKYLYLWDNQLLEDPFSILKHLTNVVVLSLCNVYNGESTQVEEDDFPKLRKLSIIRFNRLKEWREIKKGALQSLEELTFSNCSKLEAIPKGLENLSRLRILHCTNMPKSFVQTTTELLGRGKEGNVKSDWRWEGSVG